MIAAALLIDEILAGELDVEYRCMDGEPIADWIDRFSRIAPPRIIADLVRQGRVTPRRFSLSVDAQAEAEARCAPNTTRSPRRAARRPVRFR